MPIESPLPALGRSAAGKSASAKSAGAAAVAEPLPIAHPAAKCCGNDSCEGACACDEEQDDPSKDRRDRVEGPNRRLTVVDRRSGLDRRVQTRGESAYTGPERRKGVERRDSTGLERRRGPGRRRSDDRKSAEEGEMNAEQFEFIMAIETYKKVNHKIYPTWTEVLEVIRQLGYRKTLPRDINLPSVPEPPVVGR